MITAVCSLVFLILGIWLGYLRSHAVFGRMVDDGQIVFCYEYWDKPSKGAAKLKYGWDGTPEAIEELKRYLWPTKRK